MEKEAKALQSELSFRDHQLTLAQSSHTTAIQELTAEKSKRRRDREKAERERDEVAAKAATAIAAANAAAAAAAAAAKEEAAAAAAAASAKLEEQEKAAAAAAAAAAKASARRRRTARSTRGNGMDTEWPPFAVTLAEIILSGSPDEVMVLLKASDGGGALHPWGVGLGSMAGDDFGDGAESYAGGDGNGDEPWLRSPFEAEPKQRGLADRISSTDARGPTSPVRTRDNGVGDLGDGGDATRKTNGSRPEGGPMAWRKGEFRGTSPLSLAFTPVRSSALDVRARSSELSSEYAARGGGGSWRQVDGELPSTDAGLYDANWGNANLSPRQFLSASGEGRRAVYGGVFLDEQSERSNTLRSLSSNLFTCMVALVEGKACAGDLLDVLTAFLEELPGESVRRPRMRVGQSGGGGTVPKYIFIIQRY